MQQPGEGLRYLDVAIQIGTLKPVIDRVQVLDSTEATLLLGRRFMGHFGPVTFDWANSRAKLGHTWVTAQSLLSGATPLARALTAKLDKEDEGINIEEGTEARLISSELGEKEESRLRRVVLERCKLTETHRILTGDAPPQKVRPRRDPLTGSTKLTGNWTRCSLQIRPFVGQATLLGHLTSFW